MEDEEELAARAAAELAALEEAWRVLLSRPGHLRDLDPLMAIAARVTAATGAILLLHEEGKEELSVEAAAGLDHVRQRSTLLASARAVAAWALTAREPLLLPEVAGDGRFPSGSPDGNQMVCVPLLPGGDPVGALLAFGPAASGSAAFHGRDVAFLGLLAGQVALAIHASRLAENLRKSARRVRDSEADALKKEKLLALGEMAGSMVEEIRRPVSAIAGFARRVGRGLPQGDLNREYLDVIVTETDRLGRILDEFVQIASVRHARLRMEDLNEAIEEAVRARRDQLTRKKARLIMRLAPGLPRLLLDVDAVRQVTANIMDSLLGSIAVGGRLKVESKRGGESVHLLIGADGPRVPGDALDRLFDPFRLDGSGGPGVGLAVASQIIREHGGEIGVRSDQDWPTLFTVSFPIKLNEDRRRTGPDRRRRSRERRGDRPDRDAA